MDGTLYEKRKEKMADLASRKLAHRYLKEKGILQKMPRSDIKRMDKNMEHGSVTMSLRYLSEKYSIDLNEVETFAYNIYPRAFGIVRNEQLIRLLTDLSKRYKLAIFTNGYDIWVERTLKALGISSLIKKGMIVSPMHLKKYLKPEQGAFRIMLKRTGFKKSEVVFLDDKMQNIAKARKMGIKSILVKNKGRNKRNSIHSILRRIAYDVKWQII